MGRTEDLLRGLERKALENDCPVCHENKWSMPTGTNLVMGGNNDAGEIELGLALEAVTLVCTNCGYIRFHLTQFLES
jgi:hypothetical protein